tara:strand:- start:621 stop:794 length:174 start_codon:yes stop_codon:yes gene_type:complete
MSKVLNETLINAAERNDETETNEESEDKFCVASADGKQTCCCKEEHRIPKKKLDVGD